MANRNRTEKAVQRLTATTRDSLQTVLDHTVGLQERNVRFAQSWVDGSIRELRFQTEANRALTQEMVERAEKQREALQALVEESVGSYMDFLYAPFSYYKESLKVAGRATR